MGKDDIIISQLDRLEAKIDQMDERQREIAKATAANTTAIGFLKAAVTTMFSSALVVLIALFKTKA